MAQTNAKIISRLINSFRLNTIFLLNITFLFINPLCKKTDYNCMKKLVFFIISIFFISNCTRSGSNQNSKIQIKLPDLSSSYSNKVGTLSEPSSLAEINCYMVFISGPETDLQKNSCPTQGDTTKGIAPRNINFGILLGGFAPSSEISFEVPSGNDRVIHLVGMRVIAPEICRDFKTFGFPGNQESSRPYILGSADRLLLEPTKTVEVPISISFSSANGVTNCTGPDVPQGGSGGDSGGNNNLPYLRFEGIGRWNSLLNKDLGTLGQCYPVSPALYQNGSAWIDTAMTALTIDVTSFNAGTFYTDSSCSTQISSLSIPAGSNKSASNYYFKSIIPLNNVTLSGWTISGGSTTVFQNSNQVVEFNNPKLMFYGPDKLPLNLCAKYKVVSEYFEGGPLNAPAGGLTINLTDNANFYLRAFSGCSTGTSVSIAPATNSTDVYLKLMSAVPAPLSSNISTANYISNTYTVQNSIHDNHADSIKIFTKDNLIARGTCNHITVRLVNFDGGSVQAKNLMNLYFKAPSGAGSFYTLNDCSGAPVNSVPLVSGETELNIGFKANSLPAEQLIAGQIPLQFHFGSIRIKDSAFASPSEILLTVVDPQDPWNLHAKPPNFNGAEIIGTHEFTDGGSPDTFKYVYLNGNYSNLVSTECSATPGTGYSSCTAAELDTSTVPYKYKWSSANAASNIPRYVRFNFSHNGQSGNREIKISGDVLYGNSFKVIQCGSIASPNESIESLTTHASGVVCLPESSTHSRGSPQAFTFTAATRTGLIGHSSGTTELNGSGQSAHLVFVSPSGVPNSNFFIANLKLRNISSGSNAILFTTPVVSAVTIGEINNVDINDMGSGSTSNMMDISNNDPDLTIKIRNSKIITTAAGNYGIYIGNSSNISIENSIIDVIGNYALYIFNSSGNGSNIKITNTTVKTTGGTVLSISNSGTSSGTGNEITNSKFIMTSPGNASNSVVKITNKMFGLVFDNNIIEAEPGAANNHLLNLFSSTASDFTSYIRSNTFLQGDNSKTIINIEGGYNINIDDFSDNSLVTTASANNAVGFFNIFSATTLNPFTNTASPSGGANIACSNNGFIFTGSPAYTNAGSIGGGLGLGTIPVIMNNTSLTSKRCKGL